MYKIRNPMAAGHYVFSPDSFIVPSGKRLLLTKSPQKRAWDVLIGQKGCVLHDGFSQFIL